MPEYVLHRAHEVMAERGIKDASKVGIYGLTYKEDVDDVRESPTLQMLESMEEHLCGGGVKVYDPWVERDEVPGQVHSMEEFLDGDGYRNGGSFPDQGQARGLRRSYLDRFAQRVR